MKCVPATVEYVHSALKYGFPCTKEMMLLETSRRALSCCAQSDLIAGAPADLCRGHPTVCSDLPGEHTPLGCWSGDCHWVPLQVLRPPCGGGLRTASCPQVPRPAPCHPGPCLLCCMYRFEWLSSPQPSLLLPLDCWLCFPAVSHHVGDWGTSHHTMQGLGASGSWACRMHSCGCVCVHTCI